MTPVPKKLSPRQALRWRRLVAAGIKSPNASTIVAGRRETHVPLATAPGSTLPAALPATIA